MSVGRILLEYIREHEKEDMTLLTYPEYVQDTLFIRNAIEDRTGLSLHPALVEAMWLEVSNEYHAGWLDVGRDSNQLWKRITKVNR